MSSQPEDAPVVSSGKKVFAKKKVAAAAADPTPNAEAVNTTTPAPTTETPPPAPEVTPSPETTEEQTAEVKSTKKVFSKKKPTPTASETASNVNDDDRPPASTPTAAQENNNDNNNNNTIQAASIPVTTTSNPLEAEAPATQDGVTEVKATKKVFGKKAVAKPVVVVEDTPPENNNNNNDSDSAPQENAPSNPEESVPKSAVADTDETSNSNNYQDEALQAPSKKVFSKKSFGQKKMEQQQVQEQQPQPQPDRDQQQQSTEKISPNISATTSQTSLTSPITSSPISNKKSPGTVLASSSATWDDWYDEVCRYFDISSPTQPQPTKDQLRADDYHILLPSGRTMPWLLNEKRFSSDQRVPLLWRASAAGWKGVVDVVLEATLREDDSEGTLIQRVLTDAGSEDGTSSLYVAAQNGHVDTCNKLISAARAAPSGALYQQVLNQRRKTGATALFIAVQAKNLEVVRALLRAGADKELSNVQKATPLVLACSMDSEDIVEILLRNGANWRDRQTKRAPLAWAGPKSKVVLEEFVNRRMWFLRWINRLQEIKSNRNRKEQDKKLQQQQQKSETSNNGDNNNINAEGDELHQTASSHDESFVTKNDEKSASDARVSAILDAMLLSMHRKQTKEFLINYNEERSILLETEHNERRDLSYFFAMREPANVSKHLSATAAMHISSTQVKNSGGGSTGSTNRGLFSPELQPTPEALKAKQLPAWAVMTSRGDNNSSNNHNSNNNNASNILISRQRMLNLGGNQHGDNNNNDNNNESESSAPFMKNNNNNNGGNYRIVEDEDRAMKSTAAASTKLNRPSIEVLVKALKAEKEDLAAGRTPKTKHGLPLGGSNNNNNNNISITNATPQKQNQSSLFAVTSPIPGFSNQGASNKFGPISNTPEAARYASNLDFSRRREFEWDARLHRISKMDSSPDPKLYAYDGNNKEFSERKPLNAPPKGLRKSDW